MFARAALTAVRTQPFFRQNIGDMIDLRPGLTPAHAVKLLERSYQAALLQTDPSYPYGYNEVAAWHDAFTTIENDDHTAEMLSYRLLTQSVQSNIAERYKTVKLLARVYKERFGDTPSHLDVGSSVLHGDIKLVYNRGTDPQRVPFGDIVVNQPMSKWQLRALEIGKKPTRHQLATEMANLALRQEVGFGTVIGVDITDVDDTAIKQWAKSCSFYPNELTDAARVAEYDMLDQLDPEHERVQFVHGDFSNTADIRKLRHAANGERFNIITFSTIFYQVSLRERHAMLVNASQLLTDDGLILIQDAPDGNFETPYRYGASVIDSTRPDLGEQQILSWKTPRCREAMVGIGRLSLGGKLRRFDEALEYSLDSA